jgi:hypothetical protein
MHGEGSAMNVIPSEFHYEDIDIRLIALDHAMALGSSDQQQILAAARLFESYLKGETKP